MKFILSLFLISFININSYAQSNTTGHINYTKENGLPSNETYCVITDKKGYIWIGTDKGVVRYNGNKFQKFDLPDNVVFKIKEADDGKIWFFTYTGKLSYFFNEKVYPYKYNDTIQKYAQRLLISDAYIFKNDELYIKSINMFDYNISSNGKINIIPNSVSTPNFENNILINTNFKAHPIITHTNNKDEISKATISIKVLPDNKLFKVVDNSNNIFRYTSMFINNEKEVYFFAKNTFYKISKFGEITQKRFDNQIISGFYDTESKAFWLGMQDDGVHVLNNTLNTTYKNQLNQLSVSGISKDVAGNYWLTTLTSGITLINQSSITNSNAILLTTTESHRIKVLDDNSLLFGNKSGLSIFKDGLETKIFDDNTNYVGDIKLYDKNTLLWVCATNNIRGMVISRVHQPSKKVYLKIVKLNISTRLNFLCDSSIVILNPKGIIFLPKKINFATLTNKGINDIYSNSNKSNLLSDKFYEIHFDSIFVKNISILNCDNILMGTLNNLYRYNIPTNKANIHIPQTTIFQKGVNSITPFKNNIQAIAIRFGGLAFIKDTAVIATITELDGLPDNSITYILSDSNQLWLASSKGLSCITFQSLFPVKYTIKNFGKEVGLGNEIIYQIIRFKKDILAATSKGIFKLSNVDSLLALPPKPIPFYVTTISTYLGDTTNITSISLPHNKNRVSINFDAIEFTTPTDIEYYYRIVNSDSTWFSISNPQLILQDLSPGNYTVELKATLPKQGRTSEIRQITITVEKPWWLKTTSLIAFTLGLASLLYLFTNWRIKKAKKKAQEKNEIATKMLKLEQTALQAQMNPHFIFNCLTGIQQLMNSNNIDEANEYLVTFSRLIRSTLENSTQEFIVLQDEIDYLKRYISLEEKRLTNELQTSFTIADNINTQTIEIPNMMLQPIIENAIRHGIKALENKAGKIAVNFKLINNTIQCIVEDNGIGREAAAQNKMQGVDTHKSFGLAIIKQRLQGYSKSYNQNFSIEVIDLQNENNMAIGTKAILHLPIKN